jgi:hypothetical protein
MSELLKTMQEVMGTQIGSVASRKHIHQARALTVQTEMKAKMDSHHEKLMTMKAGKAKIEAMSEACLEKTEVCVESKQSASEERKSEAVHEEALKEETAVKTVSTEEAAWGPESSRRAPQSPEEADPGQWWVPEEVGCRLQRDDSPYHSGTA